MKQYTTQAIILNNILFQDKKSIITAYTEELGLATFMVKGLSPKRSHLFAITNPLTLVQAHYRSTKSDWLHLLDGKVLHDYPDLKQSSWEILQEAGNLCKILNQSLLPRLASHKIFNLLDWTLKQFSKIPSSTLIAHFLLKTLSLEGVAHFDRKCRCQNLSFGMQEGSSFCHSCARATPWLFQEANWQLLLDLALAKRLSDLSPLVVDLEAFEKIKNLFYSLMERQVSH